MDRLILFFGHLWLQDENQKELDPWPKSGLSRISKKKFIFLNKEYTNLSKDKMDKKKQISMRFFSLSKL